MLSEFRTARARDNRIYMPYLGRALLKTIEVCVADCFETATATKTLV